MTDELMIQPQRVSTMPYALGGAAIGATAAGIGTYAYNSGKGGAKSYEELVKSANEKDVVDLKAKKAALDEAEKKLSEAGKAVYEGNELNELNTAKKNLEEKLAELTASKETSSSEKFKVKEWSKFRKDFKANELPTTNERTGKSFTLDKGTARWENEVKAEYERLTREYNSALSKFERNEGAKDIEKLQKYEDIIKNYMDGVNNRRKNTGVNEFDKIFSTEAPSWRKPFGAHADEFRAADNVARKIYPEVTTKSKLTNAQVKSFAERLEEGAKAPSGHNNTVRITEVVDGRNKTVKYTFSNEMFNDFKKSENEKIADMQKELREALLGRAPENIELAKKKANFESKFIDSITKDQAKRSGFKKADGTIDFAKILSESGVDPKKVKKVEDIKFYNGDIKTLEDAVNKYGGSKKLSQYRVDHPKAQFNGKYAGARTLQEALDMAQARKDALTMYAEDWKALEKDLKSNTKDFDFIKTLKEKIETAKGENKALAEAKEALIKQFPGLAEGGSTTAKAGMTEEAAKATEAYKKLAKIVEDKQAIYDKVAGEKGKVNEAAKQAAENVRNNARTELDNLMKKLGETAKGMSGTTKAAIIGGTALIAGLIGMGMANSKNKAAEEAAQRQIIA